MKSQKKLYLLLLTTLLFCLTITGTTYGAPNDIGNFVQTAQLKEKVNYLKPIACGKDKEFVLLLLPDNKARLYDSKNDKWITLPDRATYESRATAVLQDGRVLIMGGYGKPTVNPGFHFARKCEIFDPYTKTFKLTSDVEVPKGIEYMSAVTGKDGKVIAFVNDTMKDN